MKRAFAALVAAILTVGAAPGAEAQFVDRVVSQFDLNLYAGGSLTSPWYSSQPFTVQDGELTAAGDEQEYGIGLAPIFGASATYWFSPNWGVRLHGAYWPSKLPVEVDGFFDFFPEWDDGLPQN
ncbi:MAG: hypothetical protein ACREKN_07015, partial [Longimicrobiaceae bacterium]